MYVHIYYIHLLRKAGHPRSFYSTFSMTLSCLLFYKINHKFLNFMSLFNYISTSDNAYFKKKDFVHHYISKT